MWDVVVFWLVVGILFIILGERLGVKQSFSVMLISGLLWPLLLIALALFGRGGKSPWGR